MTTRIHYITLHYTTLNQQYGYEQRYHPTDL